jgi:hypothetical protein
MPLSVDEAIALLKEDSKKHAAPCAHADLRCPRCDHWSGDSWAQCGDGPCPMPASPVYSEAFLLALGRGLSS